MPDLPGVPASAARLTMTHIPLTTIEARNKAGVQDIRDSTHDQDTCISHREWLLRCVLFGEHLLLVEVLL